MKLSDFKYHLDPSLIAQHPVSPRDRSRLLVLFRKTGRVEHRHFYEVIQYLDPGDVLILNNTKVFPARIYGKKEKTGGRLALLLVQPVQDHTWKAFVSGHYRIGQRILFDDHRVGEIVSEAGGGYIHVRFHVESDFHQWLEKVGTTPLPPYIKRIDANGQQEKKDRLAYQTVYATFPGSIAAPTAGLHFTEPLLDQIRSKGVAIHSLTLHVGPGTFKPVRVLEIEQHTMESEYVRIPFKTIEAIQRARESGKRVVAVGTTTVRAVESIAHTPGMSTTLEGLTSLFVTPGYRFKMVDGLITNFHLPYSTLLMLVSAFTAREQLLEAYQEAIQHRYRFYSFGDAMLIL